MDYGNTKITSMQLYPRRWNVAAQVVKELKTVTYATPRNPMEERRKKERKCTLCIVIDVLVVEFVLIVTNNNIILI